MKLKTIFIICIIFLVQGICFSKEIINNKQVEAEQIIKENIENNFENNKSLIYEVMVMEDYFLSEIQKENSKSILVEIMKIYHEYKKDTNNVNYVYSKKVVQLYSGIIRNIINKRKGKEMKEEINPIILSDDVFDKLDKNLLNYILQVNVIAENINK